MLIYCVEKSVQLSQGHCDLQFLFFVLTLPAPHTVWQRAPTLQVFMISYMLDKQGYLITNREVRIKTHLFVMPLHTRT